MARHKSIQKTIWKSRWLFVPTGEVKKMYLQNLALSQLCLEDFYLLQCKKICGDNHWVIICGNISSCLSLGEQKILRMC